MKRPTTPEQWEALQARVDRWAEGMSDQKLAGHVQGLQWTWRTTQSGEVWDKLHCLYAVQKRRRCKD